MAKKDKETAIATNPQQTAMVVHDYGEDAVPAGQLGRGFENQSSADVSIPFIVLLQPNSPVVAEQKVPGAMAGMWMNTVTQTLWSNPGGLLFVPATTRHEYIRYVPRDLGGGFVGKYSIDDPVVLKAKAESKKFGEYYVDTDTRKGVEGDELTETFSVFGAVVTPEEEVQMAVIPFKSTMIRAYKNMMTQIRQHTVVDAQGNKKVPPLWAHLCRMVTEGKKNDQGFFFIPNYEPAIDKSVARSLLAPADDRFKIAKMCAELANSGTAKVDYQQTQQSGGGGGEDPPF